MARVTSSKAIAARKSWQERAETWREKIKVSNLITRLEKHAAGEVEMGPTQVKAAQILLDRVIPTLSSSEIIKRSEILNPRELIARMRERYGDEFAALLVRDYVPDPDEDVITRVTHDPGHA